MNFGEVTAQGIIAHLDEPDEQMTMAREYVAQGVALLDEYHLGRDWIRRVSWPELCMSEHLHCVLGQVFGSFSTGVGSLRLTQFHEWIINGFEADQEDPDSVSYGALHAAWLEVRDAVG